MKCRCCDATLSWSDLRMKQDDGSPEDFCGECRGVVNNINVPEEKEYILQNAVEGVKPPTSFDD